MKFCNIYLDWEPSLSQKWQHWEGNNEQIVQVRDHVGLLFKGISDQTAFLDLTIPWTQEGFAALEPWY